MWTVTYLNIFISIYFIQERTKRDVEPHVYSQVAEGTGGAIYRFNTSLLGELMIQISEVRTFDKGKSFKNVLCIALISLIKYKKMWLDY